MTRGDIYLVRNPSREDPKRRRAFVVVSRQVLIDSKYATVVCAPVYTQHGGLATQVAVGPQAGLKHHSAIHCDGLISLPKTILSDFVGSLDDLTMRRLNTALSVALGLESGGEEE